MKFDEKNNAPRWENEPLVFQGPTEKCVCVTCKYAYDTSNPFYGDPFKANCPMYPCDTDGSNSKDKPSDISFSGASCEFKVSI